MWFLIILLSLSTSDSHVYRVYFLEVYIMRLLQYTHHNLCKTARVHLFSHFAYQNYLLLYVQHDLVLFWYEKNFVYFILFFFYEHLPSLYRINEFLHHGVSILPLIITTKKGSGFLVRNTRETKCKLIFRMRVFLYVVKLLSISTSALVVYICIPCAI